MTLDFVEMKCMSYSGQKTMKEQIKFSRIQIVKLVLEGRLLDHTEAAFSNFEGSLHFKTIFYFRLI